MRKIVTIMAFVGLVLGGGVQVALAGHQGGGPGPNGHNNHGLCTAYFNGSDRGRDMKRSHSTAFLALEDEAEESHPRNNDGDTPDNDVRGQQAVEYFCGVEDVNGNPTPDNSIVGGNPDYHDPKGGNYQDGSGPKK